MSRRKTFTLPDPPSGLMWIRLLTDDPWGVAEEMDGIIAADNSVWCLVKPYETGGAALDLSEGDDA